MKLRSLQKICIALLCSIAVAAQAAVISINDFSQVDSFDNDPGIPLFRIVERYTPAADNGGVYHRYEYSVENLTTDLSAMLFRLGNPDLLTGEQRVRSAPDNWTVRGARSFLWETASAADFIAPGATLSGFVLNLTQQLPFERVNTGWVMARNAQGQRVDVFGSMRTEAAVPGPATIGLLGLSVFALGWHRRQQQRR